MKIAVIVFFIVVLIITFRITISIKFNYSVYENKGEIKIMLFNFIRVFSAKLEIAGPFIKLKDSKQKDKLVKLDLQDKNIKFVTHLQKNIISKIYLIAFNSKLNFGNEDSFLTANIMGLINIISRFLYYKIWNFENDATISMQTFPNFAQNKLELILNMKFIVSIFDLLYATLKTILEEKFLNYEKQW